MFKKEVVIDNFFFNNQHVHNKETKGSKNHQELNSERL